MKNILVTGAAGFIGSNFAEYMVKKHPDYKIVVLDKLTYAGNMDNLKNVINDIKFIKGDICDFDLILKIFTIKVCGEKCVLICLYFLPHLALILFDKLKNTVFAVS